MELEIRNLKQNINTLSREFLKIEEQQNKDQSFLKEQQGKLLEVNRLQTKVIKELEEKLDNLNKLEKKMKKVNYSTQLFLATFFVLSASLGFLAWDLNKSEKINIRQNIAIGNILKGKQAFWYDTKNHNIYLKNKK